MTLHFMGGAIKNWCLTGKGPQNLTGSETFNSKLTGKYIQNFAFNWYGPKLLAITGKGHTT